MVSYEDYTKSTLEIIDKSRTEKRKYSVTLLGKEFIVFPGVFSPKYFFDTEFFAKVVPVKKGQSFLEIGPGTGIISVTAAMKGAKVTCVDINKDAVLNTLENAKKHSVRVEAYRGSLYDPVRGRKFDTIFWNTPFAYSDRKDFTVLERAVVDPGYVSTKRFISEAKDHLTKEGRLLIGFSTTLGRFDLLKRFLDEAGFKVRLLHRIKSSEGYPVFFELFEAVRK